MILTHWKSDSCGFARWMITQYAHRVSPSLPGRFPECYSLFYFLTFRLFQIYLVEIQYFAKFMDDKMILTVGKFHQTHGFSVLRLDIGAFWWRKRTHQCINVTWELTWTPNPQIKNGGDRFWMNLTRFRIQNEVRDKIHQNPCWEVPLGSQWTQNVRK